MSAEWTDDECRECGSALLDEERDQNDGLCMGCAEAEQACEDRALDALLALALRPDIDPEDVTRRAAEAPEGEPC